MRCEGRLYERLWHPFFLAALNTEPAESAAAPAAAVIRETLMKGAGACRPLVAAHGLTSAFIDPALRFLETRNASVCLGQRLRAFSVADARITKLEFDDQSVPVDSSDAVILAVPAPAAEGLMPGLAVPQNFRAIVNAHFKVTPPASMPPILGVISGLTEWLFAYPDRLSVTISGADRLLDIGRQDLAERIWAEVAQLTHLSGPLPPWQIIKEKRATFATTLDEETRRPGTLTPYANLFLAGDWTATGLPATIEGAIRSGNRAAEELIGSH
jgi:predicted NAD/FAD-dependent oxidoreductase